MNATMLNFEKPPALPPQLQWKHEKEPALLEWTIRARNYNTFVANLMFFACLIAITTASFFIYQSMDDDPVFSATLTSLFFITVCISLISITHQKINFAYRLTRSGIEYCKWKNLSKYTFTFLKWFSGITAIAFILLAVIDPAFLIGALIGPGGMGLTYLLLINSKNYQEMHTQHHHYAYRWEDITQLAIATNREVVDLKYSVIQDGDNHKTNWNLNIFCGNKQKKTVANLIKPYLSKDVPFITAKVDVPLSTD